MSLLCRRLKFFALLFGPAPLSGPLAATKWLDAPSEQPGEHPGAVRKGNRPYPGLVRVPGGYSRVGAAAPIAPATSSWERCCPRSGPGCFPSEGSSTLSCRWG